MDKNIHSLKNNQKSYTNQKMLRKENVAYESNYFHDYFRSLPFDRLNNLLDKLNISLADKSILIAACGKGIDVHYFRKYYSSEFFVSDISENAVKVTMIGNTSVFGLCSDLERLPFRDESFDYSYVGHSLHHLPHPPVGIYELIRVSKNGVIFIEPNDSWLMQIATKLKLATEIEEAGNYVFRFSGRDIEKLSRAIFMQYSYTRLFAIHRVAKSKIEFVIIKILNSIANIVAPKLGNTIISILIK